MNGEYYYNPDQIQHLPDVNSILGMSYEALFGFFLLGIMLVLIGIFSTWEWWKLKIYVWRISRKRRRSLRSGKGKIKSFIIEVAGRDLTESKFKHITKDINAIMEGKVLKGVANKDIGKELDSNNIIGITDIPGTISHFFVIWYKEV